MHLRVVLVEDSIDDALLLEHFLQQGGFDTACARVETADALHAALAGGEWDVVIADHVLPSFSATGALEVLQRSRLDIPLIVVSGQIGEETAVSLMRAGATDYVPKNNLARLIPAIAREVRDARSRADRRQAAAQLLVQAQLLRAVGQAIFATDITGRISYWNPAAEQIFGWTAAQAIGRLGQELVTTTLDRQRAAEVRAQVNSGQAWSGELQVRRRDGGLAPILMSASPTFDEDGHSSGVVAVCTDIYEIKERERHLAALAAVSAALREALDRPALRAVVLEQVLALLRAAGALLIGADGVVELGAGRWVALTGRHLPADTGPLGQALEGGAPLVAEAAGLPQLGWLAAAGPAGEEPVPALAVVPLRARGQALGALAVGSGQLISQAELRLLEAIADAAANALYSAALFEQVQGRAEQLRAVSVLGQGLAETLDLPQVYTNLFQAVLRLWPDSTGVTISRFEPRRQLIQYVFVNSDGAEQDPAGLPSFAYSPDAGGPQSQAIRQRRALILGDLPGATRGRPMTLVGDSNHMPHSGLYAPMLAKGEVVGVVSVQALSPERYSAADADLLALVANTAAVAVINAQLFEDAIRRLGHLEALRDIDVAISASLDVEVTLTVCLSQVTQQLEVDAAQVLLLNPTSQMLDQAGSRGFRRANPRLRVPLRLGEGPAGRAVLQGVTQSVPDLAREVGDPRAALLAAEQFACYFAVPLVAKGQAKGVLEVFHRQPLDPTPEWMDFLETLAAHAAIAVDQAELFNHLQQSNAELSLAYDATIEGWSAALDLRDKMSAGQTQQAAQTALRLARALAVSDTELVHLRRGALLHDIGKMGIPDSILLKPGPLDEAEWEIMRQHPLYARDLLAPIPFLRPALDIPYCHHEKWDGSGYPRGLKGEEIPVSARIFAVVDVWDALTSARPYRPAWPADEARAYLRAQSGAHFEPRVVEAFLKDGFTD